MIIRLLMSILLIVLCTRRQFIAFWHGEHIYSDLNVYRRNLCTIWICYLFWILLLLRAFILIFHSLFEKIPFCSYNPWKIFLIAIRYALEQGAQGYAIDIEHAERDASTGNLASMHVIKHQLLRRNEAEFLDKDNIGLSWLYLDNSCSTCASWEWWFLVHLLWLFWLLIEIFWS